MINFKKNLKNSLVRENFFFFLATNILNVFAFLFHFYMGRKLGPEDYGVLGVLLALIYLFNITSGTIQSSIAKFTSIFKAKKNFKKIKFLLRNSVKKLFFYGILFNLTFILISPLLAKFLHIPVLPLIILSFMISFEFILPVVRGALQGLQKFNNLGFNLILED